MKIGPKKSASAFDSYAGSIVHALKQPLVLLAPDLRVVAANPSFHHTFGTSPDDATGRPILDVCGEGWERADARQTLQAVASGEPSGQFEVAGWLGLDSFLVTASLVEDDGPPSILITFEEITERKRHVEQFRQEERRREEFLTMLAHELRSPIAAIDAACRILQTGPNDERRRWAEEVIERHTKHMARLVDDLMDVCRVTRGKLQLRKEPVSLGRVLASAIEATKPLIDRHSHELVVSLASGPMDLDADPMRLEQVLVNLLTNAAKYTDRGGRISVSTRQEGGQVVIKIADNGKGIEPALLPHIFEWFTQIEQTRDRSDGGLGIGLAIVQMLVGLHHGEVTAKSDGPGQGSEFTLRLPLTMARKATWIGQDQQGEQPGSDQCRLLVGDDSVDTADTTALLLRMRGYPVHVAHDARAALDLARTYEPNVILLDIDLPDINGYRLAEMLRNEPVLSTALLIAVSGYGGEEDGRRAHSASFNHHLVKPIDFDSLHALIADWDRARHDPGRGRMGERAGAKEPDDER